MLRINGSKKTLCDGLTRRDLLHIGALSALGLTLADALRLKELQAGDHPGTFGKAKACILLFLFGSPPQHETFDPKPDAPDEIRGEMKSIASAIPGLRVGQGLPEVAKIVDRTTVVRSLTHPYPLHGVAYALTGMPTYTPAIEAKPRDPQHWPFLGSIVHFLQSQRPSGQTPPSVPQNVGLPWMFGSKATDYPPLAGPYASFLGSSHDPIWTDFSGKGTSVVPKLADAQTQDVYDPFAGVKQDAFFELAAAGSLSEGVTPGRLASRRTLLAQFDHARDWLQSHREIGSYDRHRQRAYSLLTSTKVRQALDVRQETDAVRERYGMTLFGQASLAARRLVEAGSRFVSVFWDPYGPFGGSCWDTHANHFPRLKDYLLPVFDQTYSALIRDLEARGMLDETLVLCLSEHGRTPQIDSKPKGAGRHHWSRVYSAILAGGGIGRGNVVGRSDAVGGDVAATPVSPKDVLATSFHLLGIDPHTILRDRLNRPVPIAGSGQVRPELLA